MKKYFLSILMAFAMISVGFSQNNFSFMTNCQIEGKRVEKQHVRFHVLGDTVISIIRDKKIVDVPVQLTSYSKMESNYISLSGELRIKIVFINDNAREVEFVGRRRVIYSDCFE